MWLPTAEGMVAVVTHGGLLHALLIAGNGDRFDCVSAVSPCGATRA